MSEAHTDPLHRAMVDDGIVRDVEGDASGREAEEASRGAGIATSPSTDHLGIGFVMTGIRSSCPHIRLFGGNEFYSAPLSSATEDAIRDWLIRSYSRLEQSVKECEELRSRLRKAEKKMPTTHDPNTLRRVQEIEAQLIHIQHDRKEHGRRLEALEQSNGRYQTNDEVSGVTIGSELDPVAEAQMLLNRLSEILDGIE